MRRTYVVAAWALMVSLFALPSSASAIDYVCDLAYIPGPGMSGTAGGIGFSLSTTINCATGTVTGYRLCSSNRTAADCPSSSAYLYSAAGLQAMLQALQLALLHRQPLQRDVFTACVGSGTSCLRALEFH